MMDFSRCSHYVLGLGVLAFAGCRIVAPVGQEEAAARAAAAEAAGATNAPVAAAVEPAEPAPAPAPAATNAAPGAAATPRAEALYAQGQFAAALRAWTEETQGRDPTPAAIAVRDRILTALSETAAVASRRDTDRSGARMAIETVEKEALPVTYQMRRFVRREVDSHFTPATAMRKILDTPVSIHLKGADLSAFVRAVTADGNINIVSDQGLGKGKLVDMELDKVPLKEVLEYVSRNFDVQFFLGENLIWATTRADVKNAPLETRVYRLHKGLQFHTSDWGADVKAGVADKASKSPTTRHDLSFDATELPSSTNYLARLVAAFVPKVDGACLEVDANTHTVFARNTPENLELIERIVDTVDRDPPQVLIEARFIEINADDLRELGIDWSLTSPWVTTRKPVLVDGKWQLAPATQLAGAGKDGALFSSPARAVDSAKGEISTADQGLNLAFQGILTEPAFKAVLHALEVSGKGRTLSVPRVTTVNNNPAKLRNGQDLLYYEEFDARAFSLPGGYNQVYTVTGLMPKGPPVLAELGITLIAVPSVGADGKTISLLLTPSLSKLEEFNYYARQDLTTNAIFQQIEVKLPSISRREVQTKVIVESGETVVMGGLIDTTTSDTIHRVPILGSLPLIGPLFRRRDSVEERRNLLIFVTASVISERGESIVPETASGAATAL